jgi:hypothetical protein
MKVVYKQSIETRINTLITTAIVMDKKIDYILVDDEEWQEVTDHFGTIATYKCSTRLPPRSDGKLYCMFNGIHIVKENS